MKLAKEKGQSLKRLLNDAALLCQDSAHDLNEPESCKSWLREASFKLAYAMGMIDAVLEEDE